MIPHIPLLNRNPYGSLISGAEYNPFTLFIRRNMKGGYLVNTAMRYPSDDKFMQEMLEDESTSFHEEFHWLQHNGTTLGAFLALLRYSQESTTINFLTALEPDHLAELIRKRNGQSPTPMVRMGPDGDLDKSQFSERHEFLNLLSQIWHDHQLVYSIFDSSECQENIDFPRGQVLGEIVGDTILYFCDRCGYEYPGNELARKWFQFDEGEVLFISISGKRLTTRGLFEGATASNELLLLLTRGASDERIEKYLEQLKNGNYGIALNIFISTLGLGAKALRNVLPTFNAICDIALNPPLPPRIHLWTQRW